GSCAGPQQTLWATAKVINTLPACRTKESAGRLVCAFSDGDAKLIAQVLRHLVDNSGIPAADKHRCHRTYKRIEAGINAPFNAAQECLCRCKIMFAGEQKSDVDGNAGKDCLLDRGKALLGPWNFDQQIGTICAGKQLLGRPESARRIIG